MSATSAILLGHEKLWVKREALSLATKRTNEGGGDRAVSTKLEGCFSAAELAVNFDLLYFLAASYA